MKYKKGKIRYSIPSGIEIWNGGEGKFPGEIDEDMDQ